MNKYFHGFYLYFVFFEKVKTAVSNDVYLSTKWHFTDCDFSRIRAEQTTLDVLLFLQKSHMKLALSNINI